VGRAEGETSGSAAAIVTVFCGLVVCADVTAAGGLVVCTDVPAVCGVPPGKYNAYMLKWRTLALIV
jgi:hypothetical protein